MNEDKSSRYHRLKRRAVVVSTAVSGALLLVLLWSGATRVLRDGAVAVSGNGPGDATTVAAYIILLTTIYAAMASPSAFYQEYALEHRYGLSSESLRDWGRDHAKAFLVGLTLAVLAGELVYATLRLWPDAWWMASSVGLIGGMVILARLAPVTLMPLFYRFKPLEREALQVRLSALSARAGVAVLGVYEWGLGDKTRRANAALVGAGGTRRVLLSDTLLADYSDDEIEVILAHELGHHAHSDLLKALLVESAGIVVALGLASLVLNVLWRPLGLVARADVAGLPLLVLSAGTVMLLLRPLGNALSRYNERRADRYALALTDRPAAFVSAMRRLATQNLAELNPSRPTLWLFHTHPPIEQRIAAARESAEVAKSAEKDGLAQR